MSGICLVIPMSICSDDYGYWCSIKFEVRAYAEQKSAPFLVWSRMYIHQMTTTLERLQSVNKSTFPATQNTAIHFITVQTWFPNGKKYTGSFVIKILQYLQFLLPQSKATYLFFLSYCGPKMDTFFRAEYSF